MPTKRFKNKAKLEIDQKIKSVFTDGAVKRSAQIKGLPPVAFNNIALEKNSEPVLDCISWKLYSLIKNTVVAIFDDQKAADWINAEDKELSRFFETSYPPFSDLKTQLRRAANFKTFIADDKSASFDIVSKINEVIDRFQEEKEGADQ